MALPFYSVLDPAAAGLNLEIQESGLVVTCNVGGAFTPTTNTRKMRAMLAKASGGVWSYEVAFYSPGNVDTLTGLGLAVGLCTNNSTLNSGVGFDGSSYGYRIADGGIYQSNVALATPAQCPPSPAKTYVQIVADLINSKMQVYNSGSLLFSQSISAATGRRVYYPCGTVGSATAYGSALYFNFGQREFAYNIPGATGWFNVTPPPPALYLGPVGMEAYSSGHSDSPADQNYDSCILNIDDLVFEKINSCWLWRDRGNSSTYSYIDLDNSFGQYWGLLQRDYRDAPVYFRVLTTDDDTLQNVSYTAATALVDRIESVGTTVMRVYLKSKRSSLNRPYQRKVIPPFADKGIAGRPYPSIIGAVRTVDVGSFLYDTATRTFLLSDGNVSNLAAIYDKGNPLDGNATPPQFALTSDMQGVIPINLPQGKFTADVSSCGPQNTYPGVPDVLAGAGSNWNSSWTGANGFVPSPIPAPTGFTLFNNDTPTWVSTALRTGTLSGFTNQMITMSSNRPLTAIGTAKEFSLKTNASVLKAGKTYRITFHMYDYQAVNGVTGGGLVVLSSMTGSYLAQDKWISPYLTPLVGGFHDDLPITLTYTVPAGADRQLFFSVVGSGGAQVIVTFYGIVVEELSQTVTSVQLQGSTLTDMMKKILTTKGGLALAEWSQTDTAALDLAYPGSPFGLAVDSPVTLDSVMQLPMDSVCGTVTEDRFGVLRFRRMVDPRTATPLATYTEEDINQPIQLDFDKAEGLTQTFGWQRNWSPYADSDFVTDYTLCPAAFRTQLKRSSRGVAVSSKQLFSAYQFAALAQQLDTVFDLEQTAIYELNRVNGFYVQGLNYGPPVFVTFTINYTGAPPEYLFGDVLAINYTEFLPPITQVYGKQLFTFNQNVTVIGSRLYLGRQTLQIIAWAPFKYGAVTT